MGSDSDLQLLGRGLRRCRERIGVSQEELAGRAGMHRNYVGLLERGERNPTAKALIELARALEVPPSELWSEFEAK